MQTHCTSYTAPASTMRFWSASNNLAAATHWLYLTCPKMAISTCSIKALTNRVVRRVYRAAAWHRRIAHPAGPLFGFFKRGGRIAQVGFPHLLSGVGASQHRGLCQALVVQPIFGHDGRIGAVERNTIGRDLCQPVAGVRAVKSAIGPVWRNGYAGCAWLHLGGSGPERAQAQTQTR